MQNKIKILNVYDKNGISGVKEVVAGINQLQSYHIDIFSLCLRNLDGSKDTATEFYFNSKSKFNPLSFFAFRRIMRAKKIDVIHSHQAKSLLYAILYKIFYDRSVRLIQHEHGEILQNKSVYKLLLRLSSWCVNQYLPVSKALANLLLTEIGINPERVTVLYNFVDLEKFNRDRITWDIKAEREKRGVSESDFLVGFAGRLVDIKGWREFIETAKMTAKEGKKIKFVIAGDGQDRAELTKNIQAYGIDDVVRYEGHVADMPRFYSLLDCFVMPSHREGLPMVQLEVAAMGVPLISAKSPGCDEILEQNNSCLYFETRNTTELKSRILSLLNGSDIRAKISGAALSSIRSFGLPNYIARLKDIYETTSRQSGRKIKVCFISRSAYPLFDSSCSAVFGGAEVDSYSIAIELAKDSRYQVYFMVGNFGQKKVQVIGGVTVYSTYRHREAKLVQMLKLAYVMIAVNADVYFREAASGGAGITALICKLIGAKFIYRTASEVECDGRFIAEHPIEGRFFKYGIKSAESVIVQTEINRSQLQATLGRESIVIKNAIQMPEASSYVRGSVLWVGRSEKLKQPNIFLDIASSFPNNKFVMICAKANDNSVDIPKLKLKAETIPNLTLMEQVPYHEIEEIFQESEILINTSIYEGFPNTFVQALSHGSAILSLNVNPDDFLDANQCGYCAKGDISDLKKMLSTLLSNDVKLNSLRENAYKYAKSNHDLAEIIQRYKSLFEGVTNI